MFTNSSMGLSLFWKPNDILMVNPTITLTNNDVWVVHGWAVTTYNHRYGFMLFIRCFLLGLHGDKYWWYLSDWIGISLMGILCHYVYNRKWTNRHIHESNNNDVGDLINIRWGLQWTKFQLHIYLYTYTDSYVVFKWNVQYILFTFFWKNGWT